MLSADAIVGLLHYSRLFNRSEMNDEGSGMKSCFGSSQFAELAKHLSLHSCASSISAFFTRFRQIATPFLASALSHLFSTGLLRTTKTLALYFCLTSCLLPLRFLNLILLLFTPPTVITFARTGSLFLTASSPSSSLSKSIRKR